MDSDPEALDARVCLKTAGESGRSTKGGQILERKELVAARRRAPPFTIRGLYALQDWQRNLRGLMMSCTPIIAILLRDSLPAPTKEGLFE